MSSANRITISIRLALQLVFIKVMAREECLCFLPRQICDNANSTLTMVSPTMMLQENAMISMMMVAIHGP